MRSLALLCLLPLTALAQASRGAALTCKDVCQRHVSAPELRARVCGRCFTSPDRSAWAVALGELSDGAMLPGILEEDDWAVRWGAVKAQAKLAGVTELHQLAAWISTSKSDSQRRACETAVHVAGSRKCSPSKLLQSGGAAGPGSAAQCWARRAELTSSLQLQMYSESATLRRESAQHLASFLEVAPARLLLDAMKSRPAQTDGLSADLLIELAHDGGPPAGRALLEAAKGVSWAPPLVDRLLAVYAQRIDAVRPRLKLPLASDRREAIASLADVSPLSTPELESALDDEDATNRLAAARALARGEALSLGALAARKLDLKQEQSLASRVKWVTFLGASQDPACRASLSGVLANPAADEALKAAALPALVDCEGGKALPQVQAAMASPSPRLRAGAVRGLALMPRLADPSKALAPAFKDTEPVVLAAAAEAAGAMHLKARLPDVAGLLEHPSAEVRLAAATALGKIELPGAVAPLGRALAKDEDPAVRVVCARVLGALGGPGAIAPLIAAAQTDKNDHVKLVAADSLRKLGFTSTQGSVHP